MTLRAKSSVSEKRKAGLAASKFSFSMLHSDWFPKTGHFNHGLRFVITLWFWFIREVLWQQSIQIYHIHNQHLMVGLFFLVYHDEIPILRAAFNQK